MSSNNFISYPYFNHDVSLTRYSFDDIQEPTSCFFNPTDFKHRFFSGTYNVENGRHCYKLKHRNSTLIISSTKYKYFSDLDKLVLTTFFCTQSKNFDDSDSLKGKIEFIAQDGKIKLFVTWKNPFEKYSRQDLFTWDLFFGRIMLTQFYTRRNLLHLSFGISILNNPFSHSLSIEEKCTLIARSSMSSQNTSYKDLWMTCCRPFTGPDTVVIHLETHDCAFDHNSTKMRQFQDQGSDKWQWTIKLIRPLEYPPIEEYKLRIYIDPKNDKVFACLKPNVSKAELNIHNWCYWNVPTPKGEINHFMMMKPPTQRNHVTEKNNSVDVDTHADDNVQYRKKETVIFFPANMRK